MTTKAERKRMNRIAELGCALCMRIHGPHNPGPVELHHLRSGGWGRGGIDTLIPLCTGHHRGNEGIHGMGTKAFERAYNVTQQELLDWTHKQELETA